MWTGTIEMIEEIGEMIEEIEAGITGVIGTGAAGMRIGMGRIDTTTGMEGTGENTDLGRDPDHDPWKV